MQALLERELTIRRQRITILEDMVDDAFAVRTQWKEKLPPAPTWAARRKQQKKLILLNSMLLGARSRNWRIIVCLPKHQR